MWRSYVDSQLQLSTQFILVFKIFSLDSLIRKFYMKLANGDVGNLAPLKLDDCGLWTVDDVPLHTSHTSYIHANNPSWRDGHRHVSVSFERLGFLDLLWSSWSPVAELRYAVCHRRLQRLLTYINFDWPPARFNERTKNLFEPRWVS